MKHLIERLEKASGPDRDIDRVIFVECLPLRQRQKMPIVPRYTSSLDAAMTLVPDNMSCELMRSAADDPAFTRVRLWDWRRGPLAIDPLNEWASDGHKPLPLALCIAALKAREEMK